MSSRPPVFTWNEELHFGPPSEPINIQTFVNQAQNLKSRGLSPWLDSGSNETGASGSSIAGWQEWQGLPEEARASVELDCNLDDIKDPLSTILASQRYRSYLHHAYRGALTGIGFPLPPERNKKGKVKKSEAGEDDLELESFKKTIEQTPLRMWKLKSAAKPYVRPGHLSDQNALDTLKVKDTGTSDESFLLSQEVLITLTAYKRNTWYPYAFTRDSQHVLPSLSTLRDVWHCIPCALKADGSMPKEITETDIQYNSFGDQEGPSRERIVGFNLDDESDRDSIIMVVEGTAYSGGLRQPDYADKLLSHLEAFKPPPLDPDAPPPLPPGPYERPKNSTPLQKGPRIDAVPLRSLTLRVNEPYWILHRGNCEHWVVVDEIRLQNPRDPTSGYPVALQRTPLLRSLCRICSKVPATLSVLNDVRLGESPGMVCKPCWELFGGPPHPKQGDDPEDRVVVVPIIFETS